jgi:NADH-quinone oxidoreductase subunit N
MNQNFELLLPEFLLAGLAFLVLLADFVTPERHKNTSLAALTVTGFIGILVFTLTFLEGRTDALYCANPNTLYDCLYRIDSYTLFFKALFIVLGAIVVLGSVDFVKRYLRHPGEYYALLIFSVLAMVLMVSSGELLTAYISLELLSFSLYALVSFIRDENKSNEAGVKYILLGALSSAILLYGISLIYTSIGDTRFDTIGTFLSSTASMDATLLAGIALIIAGLGFKVAAVPFHMWAPDIYEGAPLPITAFLAVASKVAAFALFLRIFTDAFGAAVNDWSILIALLAAITMTVGNLVALTQHNIKRLLAYSSIGQAGYMLMAIAALSAMAAEGLMLHMVGYAATTLALFVSVIAIYNLTGKDEISDFDGLSQRAPFVALVISSALFSLAGLPFFAGFITKFYLFTAVAAEGFLWLTALAMLNSLISLYYYLTIIRHMYIVPPPEGTQNRLSIPLLTKGVLGALLFAIVVIGVYPAPLMDAIVTARSAILP